MTEQQVRFDDGAGYEQIMGVWSRLAGNVFLDWLKPETGLRWADVGCGNGAFTELIFKRCAPAEVHGIDPSEAQLEFARKRAGTQNAKFQTGDAMALPFPKDSFDVAVMALVIFFVPEPTKGVAEMARVVRPGGQVAAYAWDVLGGKTTTGPVQSELRAMGYTPSRPPSAEASRVEALQQLWKSAGIDAVETREIDVQRTFDNFEDFWTTTVLPLPVFRPMFAAMPPKDLDVLKTRVSERIPADTTGHVTLEARANAVKGRMPA